MRNGLATPETGEMRGAPRATSGLNTIVQESHPQTGVDLTYISQSGDTSAPPSYAATGGDRYVGLDQFGRVDDQFYVNPSTVTSPTDRFQYSYDLDGNVLYKDVTEMGGTAATYSQLYHASAGLDSAAYDGQDRLTSFSQGTLSNTNAGNGSVLDTVASPTLTEGFTLDSVGNWDTFSNSGTGGETRTFNAQNEITNNSGSTTPTYDYDGNMTKNDGGATLVYNAWNQLVSYNGSVAQYEYLPGGQRASATTCSTGNTQFSYFSTDWQDLEDDLPPAGSGGSVQATTYVWGLENVNELVERDSSAGVRLYAQHDANMDVTALLTTGGTVVERFSYDPYGVGTVLSAAWAATSDAYNWTYRWQGGLYDLTTELYSFQRRDYSPTLGTWLENDPAGYIDGPNTYQAMLGAPIEKTDPYGLQAAPSQPGGPGSNGGSGSNSSGSTGGGADDGNHGPIGPINPVHAGPPGLPPVRQRDPNTRPNEFHNSTNTGQAIPPGKPNLNLSEHYRQLANQVGSEIDDLIGALLAADADPYADLDDIDEMENQLSRLIQEQADDIAQSNRFNSGVNKPPPVYLPSAPVRPTTAPAPGPSGGATRHQ